MCIRIKGLDSEVKYDAARPLEEQIVGSKEVVIKYDPKDPDIDAFLCEMERMCSSGISIGTDVRVDVIHNNHLKGVKAKRQVKRLNKDLSLNEAIKLLTNLQSKTDKTLEELSIFCRK